MPIDDGLLLSEGLIALGLAVERLRASVCRELDLTPQQVQLVCALDHGQRTSGGLARLLACDKTNITGLVDRLGSKGLVHRVRDEADRRIVHIALTDEGRQVVNEFRRLAGAQFAAAVASWPHSEQQQLARAARKAVQAFGPDLLPPAVSG
ncbi:MarR family winged helix-turn-helix transcriptional regulator [Kribbella kalugense]|nr:MarR family transcriptional regulator [Kribbella kalugense]